MIKSWLAAWTTLDLRGLAAMRIGLGLCGLYEFFIRLPVMDLIYSGSASIATTHHIFPSWLLSGHHASWWAWTVWGLGVVSATLFALGWRTRLAQVVLLVCLLSFHAPHFETGIGGGSAVLRQTLFIALALPLGERWAVQARHSGPGWARSWACFALALQFAVIYFNTAFAKSGPSWTRGTAIQDLVSLDAKSTAFAHWLRPLITHDVSAALTQVTLVIELVAPLMLLLPLGYGITRRLAALVLVGFHIGIFLTLNVGHFSLVMISVLLALGASSARNLEDAPPRWNSAFATISVWLIVVFALQGNVVTSKWSRAVGLGEDPVSHWVARRLYWEQDWRMFAPSVMRIERRVVVDGLRDGQRVDPLTGAAPHQGRFNSYPFYLLWRISNTAARPGRAEALADWARREGYTSVKVRIIEQLVQREGEGPTRADTRTLFPSSLAETQEPQQEAGDGEPDEREEGAPLNDERAVETAEDGQKPANDPAEE